MKSIHILWKFAACCLFLTGLAWTQANVNEGLETVTLYVDANTGSDSNPGTQAQPFKTINRATTGAVLNNQLSIGTRVIINSGIYRETLTFKGTPQTTSLPITLQAAQNGKVKISGSDVWTGWQAYSGNSNIYTHPWPYAWGLCPRASSGPIEQGINLRREMIFVNRKPLTQVLTFPELVRGTFLVDEGIGVVYIYPPLGTNIDAANVEVATRKALLTATNWGNLVLRGLRFEDASDCRNNDTVKFSGGSNILIESDGFNWNNSGGFGINSVQGFTIRNSVANHNGQRGFKSNRAKSGVWNNDQANYNNWRGSQGGIYGWAAGGFYFYSQHNNTVQNLKMLFNMSHAVHWDTDNANVTARSLIASHNLRDGLVVEKSQGPLSISNSYVCFNSPMKLFYDGGMTLRASRFVTLTGNSFSENGVSQIPIIGVQGGPPLPATNYETGEVYNLYTQNLTLQSNTVVGNAGQQLFHDFDQAGEAWNQFKATLSSDNNLWWSGSVSQPFTVPAPAYFTTIDWQNWLSVTGQDSHSIFSAPAVDPTIPCQVQPDSSDFWFVNNDNGSLTVKAGTAATYTMFVMPQGTFNSPVYFASHGVDQIPGANKSWSQSSLPGSGTVTFTVKTSSKTPAGMYPVTLSARSGDLTHTMTAFLVVQ